MSGTFPTPSPSATVILLRDTNDGIETLLLRQGHCHPHLSPFAGLAVGGDGTVYVAADGDGSVLAVKRA